MKYPKPWDAGEPAGRTWTSSAKGKPGVQLGCYVNRPGTPDHTRLIRVRLSLQDAEQLAAELLSHVKLRRTDTEVQA